MSSVSFFFYDDDDDIGECGYVKIILYINPPIP